MKTSLLLISLIISMNIFSQKTVCFTIETNPNSSDPALGVFSKYIDVFGCSIYAESSVSDEKMLHVAAVWAELIDNNEDGIIDDEALINELVNNEALMPIFQADENAAMMTFFDNYNGDGVSAVLWQSEIDPSKPGHWGDDATVEEVLHTINGVGHVNIYPSAFSLSPNSSLLSTAMDTARGGQFSSIPSPYPASAWYHYDDNTCDYECMAIEYMYWSIVSLMGILNDTPTCNGIADEWELCSPTLFQNTDILMYELITNPIYKLPQIAPDGSYCPNNTHKPKIKQNAPFTVYPNPAKKKITLKFDNETSSIVKIQNSSGQTIIQTKINSNKQSIDIKELPKGVYIILIDDYSLKFIKE